MCIRYITEALNGASLMKEMSGHNANFAALLLWHLDWRIWRFSRI